MTTPLTKSSDFDRAAEVIRHLTDSDLLAKRLSELRGMVAAVESKTADLKSKADKYAMADRMAADATAKLAGHKERADAVEARHDALAGREQAVARAEREYAEKSAQQAKEQAARENAVASRERDAASKHAKLDKREAELAARERKAAHHQATIRTIAADVLKAAK
jgi:hypothetical protein